MPFKLKIENVKYGRDEIGISGRIISGSYSGPEAVTIHGEDGSELNTFVTTHLLQFPEGWPIIPAHKDTIVTINIEEPDEPFRVDRSRLVIGNGTLLTNSNRIDISNLLSERRFWALEFSEFLQTEECETPYIEYFGISSKERNNYHLQQFDKRYEEGIWPFVRINLDQQRYIEIEYAAGIEYQTRFWIGQGDRRVILGYNSGHFSFPAFRIEEIMSLSSYWENTNGAAAAILLLTGVYLPKVEPKYVEFISSLFAKLPGITKDSQIIAQAFAEGSVVSRVKWKKDRKLGWTNNGEYSQRNPSSVMSTLSNSDFEFIDSFLPSQESKSWFFGKSK